MGDRAVTVHHDLSALTTWDSDWAGLRVLVTGLGVTGFSVADTLAELGAEVVVVDGQDDDKRRHAADTLKIVGVREVLLGHQAVSGLPDENLWDGPLELVVTSPGWNPAQPVLAAAATAGVPIWSEIDLAWRVRIREGRRTAEWLALTGTNGKTTVVTMAESMAQAAGLDAIAVGNVGTPILDAIRRPEGFDVLIIELSSFQLHWTHHFEPAASAVLNIAEDHLDWHGGFDNYAADKAKIYENTRVACIFNENQPATMRMVENADVQEGCRAISFTTDVPARSMFGVVDGLLVDRAFLEDRHHSALELAAITDIGVIVPEHQVANALAAAALVRAIDVPPQAVKQGLRNYAPEPHRVELIAGGPQGETLQTLWIDDTKATNPHATDAALKAFNSVIWVAGGLPKGLSYDQLVKDHASRLKAVIVIGLDPAPVTEALTRHAPEVPVYTQYLRDTNSDPTDGWSVMTHVVELAAQLADDEDTVLLSPAAASFDQFSSYGDRGDAFQHAVRQHLGIAPPPTDAPDDES
ncbi:MULTISPECIES: UDP-N-acetylmuramoyl-L-alanine--D-glutamate ligase [Auritidibacter]|uniref:UDP-N-acetylmuramoyl-L-alanine--D-glutamate ligase n=1 Tax=Auritidibacter TaxID=1160973 RepID=UPI000D7330AD|nr:MULTISPECIES: UDP-N-acetylmuramoyl-L-alanine--D-glutamate ligase [Auritidibacter]AXR73707.1 UDP-N-acetylmuramoyl-L-alanine--D-glutamate ligase [Auritidibacter sp. NML130574]PXA76389.1 UDP-N-acetylmuramoyl-L-alanine--D-glutamate ligase [Auritidibacter sp. NML100628]PXA81369.1 UDP-N-acetylmuramoyl-L-alanine--D-glutamate ligase [Auritidibacter sp. NML120636]RMX23610.1 UDP-N-acetylmuramoyl-L-alanine--D-glutamate ligase [Auritidibacter ignavus]WGH82350.1 UDP-N-acetylmuramoyl-L-alanine--D-glutama